MRNTSLDPKIKGSSLCMFTDSITSTSCIIIIKGALLVSIHFLEGGVWRRNPYEHECKISLFVKKCDPSLRSSKI